MAITQTYFYAYTNFWSIYLNIFMNCIIFSSKTPQILTVQFRLLRNSWIFHQKTRQIKWYL